MRVYWIDVREWLTTALIAISIGAAAGLFGWVVTSNLLAAMGIGVGWYTLTRISVYADLQRHASPEELEARALWKELRRRLRQHKHGEVLFTDRKAVCFTVHRARMRAFERVVSQEIDGPQDDGLRGVMPQDYFCVPSRYTGFVIRTAVPLVRDSLGRLTPAEDRYQPPALSRRERKMLLNLELQTGTHHVALEELREVTDQLRHAASSH